jgi:GAF domain-containing protein
MPADVPFGAVPVVLSRDRAVVRLHALTAIAKAATGSSGFVDVLRRTSEAAQTALEAASLSISVWERDQARVRCSSTPATSAREVYEPVDETYQITDYPFITRMFSDGVGFVQAADAPTGRRRRPDLVRLCVCSARARCERPVVLESRVWGELFATRDRDAEPFGPDDVDYAMAVAGQVAAGIAQAQHVEA